MSSVLQKYKLVIFGTGLFAKSITKQLTEPVYMYLDNDQRKHQTQFNGVEIYLPKVLKEKNTSNYKILVASSYYKEIALQLTNLGLLENKDFFDAKWLFIEEYKGQNIEIYELENFTEKIRKLKIFPIKSLLNNYLENYRKLNPKDSRIDLVKRGSFIPEISDVNIEKVYLSRVNEDFKRIEIKNVHFIFESMYCKAFYDYIQKQSYKDDNLFILINESSSNFNFFENDKNNIYKVSNLDLVKYSFDFYLINLISNAEKVFVHYLRDSICELFENPLIKKPKTYWLLWGADLYGYLKQSIYGVKTKQLMIDYLTDIPSRKKFIKELNGILTWNIGDINLVKQNYETSAKSIHFAYPQVADFQLLDLISKGIVRENEEMNILIGNSGAPTNNHKEIFEEMVQYIDKIEQIVVPLSYGEKNYIDQVSRLGYQLFNEKFIPLYDFLDIREYAKVVNKCDLVFMNHRRQQGFGNIALFLYLGKAVFLSEKVTTYDSLTQWGIKVNSIESFINGSIKNLDSFRKNIVSEAKYNQDILKRNMGKIESMYKELFS